jgi:hypothetical protein
LLSPRHRTGSSPDESGRAANGNLGREKDKAGLMLEE